MFNKTPPNKTELAEVTPTADAYLTKSGTSKYFDDFDSEFDDNKPDKLSPF